jgi:hypothetical protein
MLPLLPPPPLLLLVLLRSIGISPPALSVGAGALCVCSCIGNEGGA